MSHGIEAQLIHKPKYQASVAKAIASAVVKYKLATSKRLSTKR